LTDDDSIAKSPRAANPERRVVAPGFLRPTARHAQSTRYLCRTCNEAAPAPRRRCPWYVAASAVLSRGLPAVFIVVQRWTMTLLTAVGPTFDF